MCDSHLKSAAFCSASLQAKYLSKLCRIRLPRRISCRVSPFIYEIIYISMNLSFFFSFFLFLSFFTLGKHTLFILSLRLFQLWPLRLLQVAPVSL